MAKVIANDIRVCPDCLAWIANGDTGDEATNKRCAAGEAALLHYYEADHGAVVPAGDENEEGFFSWSECDCCRDGLGGMRYLAAILGE
jgi:hypothetical protein